MILSVCWDGDASKNNDAIAVRVGKYVAPNTLESLRNYNLHTRSRKEVDRGSTSVSTISPAM